MSVLVVQRRVALFEIAIDVAQRDQHALGLGQRMIGKMTRQLGDCLGAPGSHRGAQLLEREGVTIGDNERIDPAIVMRVLEAREELAEARAAHERGRLEALRASMQDRRAAAIAELSEHFNAHALPEVKRVLIGLRYIDRYLEECDAALDEA